MRSPVSRSFVFSLVSLFPLAALAAAPVGTISGGAAGVEWTTSITGYDAIVLTVAAPDGAVYRKVFQSNQTVRFGSADLAESGVVNGTYRYELRVVPAIPTAIKAALAAARAADNDALVAQIKKANGLDSPQVTQSGAFGARNMTFLDPNATESNNQSSSVSASAARRPGDVASEDDVIPDDLIVQGSACVGFDCVNGESFSYDTLRLKENNLRIDFTDTSTAAGFPTNDWTIIANDSSNGGSDHLSFFDDATSRHVFLVEGGAPYDALRVNSLGDVGLSQMFPELDLHITRTDTPAIRMQQTSGGGWPAQTWDIGANEASFFVRDVTGGSRLPFRIRPGAPSSSIDIGADGDIGFGGVPNANTFADFEDNDQVKARIAFTGQEFFDAAYSSNDGVALILGTNRTGNRQLWIGDTAALTQNSTNAVIRLFPSSGTSDISALGTDGITTKTLTLNQNGGSVGVGTSSPSSRFHVSGGDIRVTGGSFIDDGVTLTAPDYVFEDSYELMPVPELAKFVKTNRHLPGVPSAKDIAKNGLNMSKFQMSLLEKIEELTLYIAAQEERIAKLEAVIRNP